MRGRPALYTRYEDDQALLNTGTQRWAFAALLVALAVLPFQLERELNTLMTTTFMLAIGAIGLNLVTGYAGQISLGHAFFVGLGAYTAAVVGGEGSATLRGLGLTDVLVWLPLAGLVPAAVGFLVAPIATRLRGLYLAIVTLGLVFIGEHVFREARTLTGGVGVGRRGPRATLLGVSLRDESVVLGLEIGRDVKLYFLGLICLLVLGLLAKNLARSAVGRAFAAVRDRDLAAEAMGVNLAREKARAFTVSSFYAGVAGALLTTVFPVLEPGRYGLQTSVEYIAMILIGGIATISGSIMGAAFLELLPRAVDWLAREVLPFITRSSTGGFLTVDQVQKIAYGALIVIFLVFEPRGLYGLWVRIRNYWRAWPFSY